MNLGNGLEVSIEDSSDKRIAIYYENDIPKQKAIFDKKSGDIYYYDLSLQNDLSRNFSTNDSISSQPYTEKYNIEGFKVIDERIVNKTLIAKSSSATYTLLKSKIYDKLGQTYKRYLYGYKDETEKDNGQWSFAADVAVTVIAAAIGHYLGLGTLLSTAVGLAGGYIKNKVFITETIKELFWVHKFSQTSPNFMEFVCSRNVIYEKQRVVKVNAVLGYWETFYTEPAWSIEYIRDDILTNAALYL